MEDHLDRESDLLRRKVSPKQHADFDALIFGLGIQDGLIKCRSLRRWREGNMSRLMKNVARVGER